MNLTRYTYNTREIDTTQYDYIIEIAPWSDTGTNEYIGVSGSPTLDALVTLLQAEIHELHEWMDEEVRKGHLDERTDEPQVARILQRPAADEDGDYPAVADWPVYFDWN